MSEMPQAAPESAGTFPTAPSAPGLLGRRAADHTPGLTRADRGFQPPPEWLRTWPGVILGIAGIVGIVAVMATALGWLNASPGDRIGQLVAKDIEQDARLKALETKLDMLPRQLMDSVRSVMAPTVRMQAGLTKYRCTRIPPEEAFKIDLPCDSILKPYGLRTGQHAGRAMPRSED